MQIPTYSADADHLFTMVVRIESRDEISKPQNALNNSDHVRHVVFPYYRGHTYGLYVSIRACIYTYVIAASPTFGAFDRSPLRRLEFPASFDSIVQSFICADGNGSDHFVSHPVNRKLNNVKVEFRITHAT